jgi:putative ABC transport system permease protein
VIRLNTPALIFSLAVALVTSLACGLVPALRSVGKELVEPLKDSGKGTGGGFRHRRLGNALVAAEVALSIVLLVCAGLLVRSFLKLQAVDLGFEPKDLAFAQIAVPRGEYKTPAARGQLLRNILMRMRALPGVLDATIVTNVPPFGPRIDIDAPGRTTAERLFAGVELCSEGYFCTLGLRLLHGRVLSEADVNGARRVAVVNQALATRLFGTETPLGRTVNLKGLALLPPSQAPVADPTFEIIGVVADMRNNGLRDPPGPQAFIPHTLTTAFSRGVIVKAARPGLLLKDFKREIWAVDRGVAMTQSVLVTDLLDQSIVAQPRLSLVVMATFAVAGLMLVAAGVFSVIAYAVSRRTHEIGIRMALGAKRGDVLGMVLGTSARVIGIGIGIGLPASIGVARVLSAQLYGIAPQDPLTVAVVTAVVIVVGIVATYVPARRATRVDPMVALRHQ